MTQNSVHGHEIMHILGAQGPLPRPQLAEIAKEKFGDSVYHTCGAQGLDLDGLLKFLSDRNKVSEDVRGVSLTVGTHVCEDE